MKITIEHENHRITVQDDSVVDICDAIDLMEKALIEIGYAPQRVEGGLCVKVREIQKELD
jgi:hypothetical protein